MALFGFITRERDVGLKILNQDREGSVSNGHILDGSDGSKLSAINI